MCVCVCACALDDLRCIVCLGSAQSGGSPLYALIIHTRLLLAERNSARRSFLHLFIFSHFPPPRNFVPAPSHPPHLPAAVVVRRSPTSPPGLSCLGRASLRVNYICYSARVNTRQGIKAEANRRRPAGRFGTAPGPSAEGGKGRGGQRPVSSALPRPAQQNETHTFTRTQRD